MLLIARLTLDRMAVGFHLLPTVRRVRAIVQVATPALRSVAKVLEADRVREGDFVAPERSAGLPRAGLKCLRHLLTVRRNAATRRNRRSGMSVDFP